MKSPVAAAFAIGVGIIILLGYLFPYPQLLAIRTLLLGWAISLSGMAGLIAIFNLIGSHFKKITVPKENGFYSLIVVISFLFTFGMGLYLSPSNTGFQKIVTAIQFPIEASFMAVLCVSLAFASVKLFSKQKSLIGIVFTISTLVFLLRMSGFLSVGNNLPFVKEFLALINSLPIAGARGIILGVALGGLIAGIRILMGVERPYSG